MPDSFNSVRTPCDVSFLWVNLTLTREACTALIQSAADVFDVHWVHEPNQIPAVILRHTPQFLCFEFDEPDTSGFNGLAQTRRAHPSLPVLMITGCPSEVVALWALRIRVWDLLVKPVSNGQLSQCISALVELIRKARPSHLRETPSLFTPPVDPALSALHGPARSGRTYPAIAHVETHFDRNIALHHAADLCRLSPSQFCRVFKQEHGLSFGQHLLRYRLDRACEGLTYPGALAKEVAYAVGFNDLSYFTRAFKRQLGVCPSDYQAGAR